MLGGANCRLIRQPSGRSPTGEADGLKTEERTARITGRQRLSGGGARKYAPAGLY